MDLESLMCERPDYLAGLLLVRVPSKELTCDHNYYYYYWEYNDYDYEQN